MPLSADNLALIEKVLGEPYTEDCAMSSDELEDLLNAARDAGSEDDNDDGPVFEIEE